VDAWAKERLSYETDNVRRTLVELAKYYFGTEFQSKTPEEKEAILREDEDATWDDDEPSNAEGNDWWSQQSSDHPAASRDIYDKYEDVLDRQEKFIADELELLRQAQERDKMGLEADPHTLLDILPYRRFLTSPVQAFKNVLRSAAEGAVVRAAKKGSTEGPGRWVEVKRSLGIEHQSKMSGKPIIERDGKRFIEEYEVNDIKFDDYKNGVLYEYKGPQGHLINKNGVFYDVIEKSMGLRDDAFRQANAAQGIPVIWRVGRNQVKAFRKAVGNVPGVIIVP
jgi:hypothetical protein